MYSLRNALASVVNNKHEIADDCHDEAFGNPRDNECIVSIGAGSNTIFSDSNSRLKQQLQQNLYSNLSSEESEDISAPSIFFQSTEESDTSSIQTPLSLSDLYHNPYEPISFIKRSIQKSESDTLSMIPAKSNYTASTNGDGSCSNGQHDLYSAVAALTSNNQSPTSVVQVSEVMVTRPPAHSTPSTGTSTTTANTMSHSFSSSNSEVPATPPKSRILLSDAPLSPTPALQTKSPSPHHTESSTPRTGAGYADRPLSSEPVCRSSRNESILKQDEEREVSPIKSDRGSPWRIKKEPVEKQDLPEKSPSRRSRGSPWRIKKEAQSPPKTTIVAKASPPGVVTPPQIQNNDEIIIISPPKRSNSASLQALASMARLQELEQKKHALRHQRFSLEQRLYQFCASKEQAEAKMLQEQESSKEVHIKPKRLGNIIKRPWRSNHNNKDQRKPKDLVVNCKIGATEEREEAGESPKPHSLEGKLVQDWQYTIEIPATNEVVSDELKLKKKKALRVLYTGRLNPEGIPHSDNATIKYSDGQVYHGCVRNGLRSGNGHNVWPDGQKYQGEWLDNSRNGRGTHSWKDGRTVTGDWVNGHLNGKIFFVWPDGATFDGSAKLGKKDGRGVHTWADGKVYNGHYFNGKENGFGTLTLPDGVKYRGQFQNGVKEGYGIMLWKTRTYDGEWIQDKPHGQGRVVWSNGAIYTGQFQAGKYHGLGVYVWPSGKKFVGRWENGVKNGHGLYTWPNGKKYDGEYKDGLKEGYGRMTWADGSTYCGGFKRNKRHGRGVQTDLAGIVVHCGLWKNDRPHNGEPGIQKAVVLMDMHRMTEDTPWPLLTPSKDDGGVPTMLSSRSSSKVMLVIPDTTTASERRDISSPLSSAEDDQDYDEDSSSGDVVLPARDYNGFLQQQSSHDDISICITDIE